MFDDDLDVPKVRGAFEPLNLESFSIDELNLYIKDLKEEIGRVEQDICKKQASSAAADAFFKS